MILVKSVDIEHVSGREAQIAIMMPMNSLFVNTDSPRTNHSTEVVQAEVFINSKKEEVIVGFSKEVQRALGMPMDAFQGMSQDIERLTLQIKRYELDFVNMTARMERTLNDLRFATLKAEEYKSASFLKRLKYLFRGRL